jgi:transcription antitermination factor NusG
MSAAAAIANGTECNGRAWYVARTMSRHEKKVADLLQVRAIDNCLPLYAAIRQWSDRTKRVMVPLFPGYVFVNIAYEDRLRVLEVPGLVGFVKFGD